jgi:hypothetical protein
MAYLRTADDLHHFVAPTATLPKKRGFFHRLFDAMVEGRRHSAEREIASFLEGNGKFLNDDAEREIERILSSSTPL